MSTTSTFKPANLNVDTNIVDPQTGLPLVSIVSNGYLTPPQVVNAYGIPASTGAGIKIGIISPGGGGFLQTDVDKAFVDLKAAGLISPSITAPTINRYLFDGATGAFSGVGEGAATFENTLDIYCVATIVPEATINMYIGYDFTNPVLAAIADGCDIITISWATSEYAYGYFETLWTQCAAAGITVVASSGDYGSSLLGYPSLSVTYPAISPQVISIGGTKLVLTSGLGSTTRLTETDDNRDPQFGSTWGGGGGISDLFTLPSWQNNLKYTPIVGGVIGSPTPLPRRGAPDVAAPMNAYSMYYGGVTAGVGGTSASAPIWAGILARMQKLTGVKRNSAQYNTIFYANTSSFYDITVGTNNTQITDGYAGTVDWDPVTGLGPPKGASLLSILSSAISTTVTTSSVTLYSGVVVNPFVPVVANGGSGNYSYGISPSLPTGLTYDDLTGEISGIPQAISSTGTYTVSVIDTLGGSASGHFSMNVGPTPLSITVNQSTVVVYPFVPITSTLTPVTATGYLSVSYSISPSLPSGLVFDTDTGEISGTPQVALTATTYTVTVYDLAGHTGSAQFVLSSLSSRLEAVPIELSKTLQQDVEMIPYTPISSIGGDGQVTFALNPSLPAGLSYNSATGEITGTPTVNLNTSSFEVIISDQGTQVVHSFFDLYIIPSQPLLVKNVNRVVYAAGAPITPFTPFTASGGVGDLTYSVSPPLPSGLILNPSTGQISGTTQVTDHGDTYTVTATDELGHVVSGSFVIKIVSPLNVINSDDQNNVYNSLFDIMGTTATGYGAILLGDAVNPGDRVNANDWNKLLEDIERCLIHQTGTSTNTLLMSNTGSIVSFSTPATMYTELQFLQSNVGQVHPSQLESFTYNTTSTSPTMWTCTNYSSTATMLAGTGYVTTVNWTWFYENQIKYFFNLGGAIQPEIGIVSARAQERPAWEAMINTANDEAIFSRTQFLAALANPAKTYTYMVTGHGTTPAGIRRAQQQRAADTPYLKHLTFSYPSTSEYSATGLVITFMVNGTSIIGTMNFVAGLGTGKKKKKKKKKKTKMSMVPLSGGIPGRRYLDIFTGAVLAEYINVQVQFVSDFKTTYPNGANGGIAAQIPQTQIVANKVSATPFPSTILKPIPEFITGVGGTTSTVITLRNNSTFTCTVSDIALRGYTTGTVTPTSMIIPAGSSSTFSVSYVGSHAGHHRGYVDVYCNVNPLTLFTEINVGSTDPVSFNITTSTYDLISQDFVVDHAGGWFKNFSAVFNHTPGYSFTEHVAGTRDKFNVTFDPTGKSNGTYTSNAKITVNPLDSSQEATVWNLPLVVNLNVDNRHIADWKSCKLGANTTLGLSYDVIGGRTYLTVGIGTGNPNMIQLRSIQLTFADWAEVYRIPLETAGKRYSKDYCVKSSEDFKYGDYFGVGTARESIVTTVYDGLGNLEVVMNTVYTVPGTNSSEVLDMSTAFRYYDSRRAYQLQTFPNLVQGGQTYCFTGFDKDGETLLSLLSPN